MKNALKVSLRMLSVPNRRFGRAEQETLEARILRGRWSEGKNPVCVVCPPNQFFH